MALEGLSSKNVYVVGLGRSGVSVAETLTQAGAKVFAWDDDANKRLVDVLASKNIHVQAPDDVAWEDIAFVFKSPGVPMDVPAITKALDKGRDIRSDADLLFLREEGTKNSFIGITGTNGKSTATALMGHVLKTAKKKVAVGGNIGEPMLNLPRLGRHGFYVLELSSFQLENTHSAVMDGAILLNLTPDHLDRHKSVEGYLAAKMKIFERQQAGQRGVIGIDDDVLAAAVKELKGKAEADILTLSLSGKKADIQVSPKGDLTFKGKKVGTISGYENLRGPHNWQNIAAVWGIAEKYVTFKQFEKALKTFVGLPHRMEKVATCNGVTFVNDSKATNPDAAIKALETYKNIYWIAGGVEKAEGLTPCFAHSENVRGVFLIGEKATPMSQQVEQAGLPAFACHTMKTAVWEAYRCAFQEDFEDPVVLLSPACASFDQFSSFEHRGDVYASAVRELVQKEGR